jgi:glycosyltransferase involved in cell wall biosynthesis
MTRDSGANLLVKAARHLIARHPDLRLWLIGDGPHRDWMYESLRGDGVRASIAMPGSFCDTDQLFAAADLFLQPDEEGLDFFLPSAVAAELPIVTIDNDSTRAVITGSASDSASGTASEHDPGALVEWVPGATSKLVRLGIDRVLDDLPTYRGRASQLRRLLLRTRPQSASVQAYVELMEKLMRNNRSAGQSSSVEAAS